MENAAVDVKSEPPRCSKCGKEPKFLGAMLDSAKGRNIRMYECQCGSKTWTSHKT
jgi:DNA-directed RNA polymerase subunit RPC12/RpoP